MSLRHSLGPLPDSSLADIHNLQQLTSQQVSRLCNIIFVFLKEQKEQDFQPQIDDFARDNGISLGPLKSIVKSTFLILNDALKRNVSAEQLRADLIGLGNWMAAERTLLINQLVDMEWKFGVTAASSETDKSGSIFLQLKMMIRRGSVTEPVYVELTLPQFYSFLHEIERAKNSLECFS
ncbi:hypothetical protein XELAEV_18004239mg [Xenopus laevis]|uniref:COMM domain-containing protein n=1 Tax=Xenopus laevis TaxID=8355 RepID=A0A974BRQ5_XENLA|nr:hypothetical protein XELAEV_18004239mg [Xenopus laevis]